MNAMETFDDKKLSTKTIVEDDLPIVYLTPDELNESSERKPNISITRAIITTEEEFNLNGYIFESEIKVEDFDYPKISSPSFECNDQHVSAETLERFDEYNDCRKKVTVKIKKLPDGMIEKYSIRTVSAPARSKKRRFTCDICGHTSNAKANLKNHMVTHVKERKFFCPDCPKKFSNIKYLEHHRQLHRAKEYKCEVCLKKYSQKDALQYHLKSHIGDKKFKCDDCPMQFLVAYQLKVHRRKHTGLRPYECTICKSKFKVIGTLQSHMLNMHSDERPFTCDYDQCSKAFKQKGGLIRHQRRHRADKNTVACKDCPKKFFSSYRLNIHRRTHTGERPYSCEFCSKTFTEKSVLENHRRIHTKEKPFACTQCPSTFSRLSTLIDHRIVHSNNRNHACKVCEKKFKSKALLKAHRAMHTEKMYSCDRCLIKFRMKKSWIAHQRTDAEKQFKCKYCNESIAWMCVFREHMKTHIGEKRFACTVCSRLFASVSLLNKHSKSHLDVNERQHSCCYCPKKFNTNIALNRHTLTHTGEKAFKCKECRRTFARKDSLNGHMKRIHFIEFRSNPKHQQKKPIEEFECYICHFKCTGNKRRLQTHIRNHKQH